MSIDFQGTKFFLALGLILIATGFVAFKVGTFDSWCFYTTTIFSIYCGAAVISRSKFMKK